MKTEKFYDMQNFAVNLLTAVNSKFGETVTLGVNFMSYNTWDENIPILQFIGIARYKNDLTKDMVGVMGDRFLNFTFEAKDDPDHGTVCIFASKK